MAINYKVSSDVDTMLRSSSNAQIRSNIGAGSETQVNSNASNIASVGTSVDTNTANIANNASNIALKAPIASPTFTGTATFSGGTVKLDSSTSNKVILENGNLDQAKLEISSGIVTLGAFDSAGSGGTGNFLSADVYGTDTSGVTLDAGDGTLNLNGDKEVKIQSEGDITLDADDSGEVAITGNCGIAGDLNVGGDHTINTGKLIAREIQCEGATTATALPIHYDSNEHRFRDYDADPTNLMLIKKVDGKAGARVGINQPSNVPTPRCALEVHYGSTDGSNREALRVMGASFFNEWIRVGHYTFDPSNAPNGSIIYRSDLKQFKGFCGSDGWKTFNMS